MNASILAHSHQFTSNRRERASKLVLCDGERMEINGKQKQITKCLIRIQTTLV